MSSPIMEMHLVDLNDEELKEMVGTLHEQIRRLEEQKKNDEEAERMRAELKEYLDGKYNDDIKFLKARLKGARSQAQVRGISFRLE